MTGMLARVMVLTLAALAGAAPAALSGAEPPQSKVSELVVRAPRDAGLLAALRAWSTRRIRLGLKREPVFLSDGAGATQPWTVPSRGLDRERVINQVAFAGGRWGRSYDRMVISAPPAWAQPAVPYSVDPASPGALMNKDRLPPPYWREVLEGDYELAAAAPFEMAFQYRLTNQPALSTLPGPASIGGVRVHAQF